VGLSTLLTFFISLQPRRNDPPGSLLLAVLGRVRWAAEDFSEFLGLGPERLGCFGGCGRLFLPGVFRWGLFLFFEWVC